jgi:hypothetical protein
MKYYTSNDLLIKENPQTKIIRVCNRTNKINVDKYIITPEEFLEIPKQQIKLSKFNELLNNWYRGVKHEWEFNHKLFRKLDNFEGNNHRISSNYILGKDIPFHNIPNKPYFGKVILVYHCGKIYYHTVSYNGYPQGQLIDLKNFELVKWTRLKNCAPIFDVGLKKIC